MSQASLISKQLKEDLSSNRYLKHSPSGNLDMFMETKGDKLKLTDIRTFDWTKKQSLFTKQLQAMVCDLVTKEVWELDKSYTWSITGAPPINECE